jgi:type II secretory pathway pseudopilin PulG
MKRKSVFTLLEIVTVVIIIGIFVSIATTGYQQLVINAENKVCKINQEALGTAIKTYTLENEKYPATLGDLQLRHIDKGYAKALEDNGWIMRISYFVVDIELPAIPKVYADTELSDLVKYDFMKKYGLSRKIFQCPSNKSGGISYGVNTALIGKTWTEIPENAIIIADCDSHTFSGTSGLAARHKENIFSAAKPFGLGKDLKSDLVNVPISVAVSDSGDSITKSTSTSKSISKSSSESNSNKKWFLFWK